MLINLMANKFLGLDSINVLKKYIDEQIIERNASSNVVTINAYKYCKDSDKDEELFAPYKGAGGFDVSTSSIKYPVKYGWDSLQNTLNTIEIEQGSIEAALAVGAIYMSVGVIAGSSATEWSTPVKISGQNGIDGNNGIKMQFAYPIVEAETETETTVEWDWSDSPKGISKEHPNEYVRTATEYDDDNKVTNWSEPKLWAVYSEDGKDGRGLYAEFQFTADGERPNDEDWIVNFPNADMSKNKPLLWARYKMDPNSTIYTDPVIYGRYGQDGTAPNYNITLYKYSNGYAKPDKPSIKDAEDKEFESLDDFLAYNIDWQLTPELLTPQLAAVEPIAITENVSTAAVTENVVEVSTFDEINAAIATATSNSGSISIHLKNDIEIPSPIIVNEGDVHINLNNKTIKAGTFKYDEQSDDTDSYVFWVKGGKLTINGNGIVESTEATYSMAVWSNGGDVDIYAGTYINHGDGCDLIYASARKEGETKIGGTIIIYGGVFKATSYKGVEAGTGNAHSALNIKNSDRKECKIEVYGGSFLGFDPSNNLSEPGVTDHSFLAPGVNATVDAFGNFVVIEENPIINLWWQCTALIDGKLNKVMSVGDVVRYTALDGTALPGEYTKFKYKWFDAQTLPEDFVFDAENWNDTPDKDVITTPEASLWMISAVVNGINSDGDLNIGEWSNPVKITGPINTVTRFCRLETRYDIGNENAVRNGAIWFKTITEAEKKLNSVNKYLYAAHYNIYYSVSFDKENNTYLETPIDELTELLGVYRLNGKDGEDGEDGQNGNKRNDIDYCIEQTEATIITSDSINNYFISNPGKNAITPIEYVIESDKLTDDKGFTYKFINITGSINFKSKIPFILPGIGEMTELTDGEYYSWSTGNDKPYIIEIVRYGEMGSNKKLIVISSDIDFSKN